MPDQYDHVAEATQDRSLADIVRDILRDTSRMIRAEIRLARTELTESARTASEAGRVLAITAVAGLLAAMCFTAAAVAALAFVTALWLSALIVGVLLALVAGGAYVWGRQKLAEFDPVPRRAIGTLKEDIEWTREPMS